MSISLERFLFTVPISVSNGSKWRLYQKIRWPCFKLHKPGLPGLKQFLVRNKLYVKFWLFLQRPTIVPRRLFSALIVCIVIDALLSSRNIDTQFFDYNTIGSMASLDFICYRSTELSCSTFLQSFNFNGRLIAKHSKTILEEY